MAKRPDPVAAKAARQKKIAIVGCVLLIAVLGYQIPYLLSYGKKPGSDVTESASAAPPPPAAPESGTPPPPAAESGPAPPPAEATPAATLAQLVDSDVPPQPASGQLLSFGRFTSKDPFVQQAEPKPVSVPSVSAVPPAEGGPRVRSNAAAPPAVRGAGAKRGTPVRAAAASGAATRSFATTRSRAAEPVAAPSSATIAVNGVERSVGVKGTFPVDDPVFRLVSLSRTAAKIGIAGGSLAGGSATVTLTKGKRLTLMNTADGARYELRLISIR